MIQDAYVQYQSPKAAQDMFEAPEGEQYIGKF